LVSGVAPHVKHWSNTDDDGAAAALSAGDVEESHYAPRTGSGHRQGAAVNPSTTRTDEGRQLNESKLLTARRLIDARHQLLGMTRRYRPNKFRCFQLQFGKKSNFFFMTFRVMLDNSCVENTATH